MRKLLLGCLCVIAMEYSYSQNFFHAARNIADIKGAIVRQEQGELHDDRGKTTQFKIIYIIDTLQKQLLNVSVTNKDRNGEVIYLYYYDHNRLAKASSGTVQDGNTAIEITYDYDEEDFAIRDKDLNAFSETEEKYAMLKESRQYLAVLKKL